VDQFLDLHGSVSVVPHAAVGGAARWTELARPAAAPWPARPLLSGAPPAIHREA